MTKTGLGSKVIFLWLFIFIQFGCGGPSITIKESDHALFNLSKNSNGNQVIYAVSTDGKCGLTGVFAYWKMEDGSTEELLGREEPYYGIKNLAKKPDGSWTFDIAKLPTKIITAQVVQTNKISGDKEQKDCTFRGLAEIDSQRSVLTSAKLDDHGLDVRGVYIYGLTLDTKKEVKEFVSN